MRAGDKVQSAKVRYYDGAEELMIDLFQTTDWMRVVYHSMGC